VPPPPGCLDLASWGQVLKAWSPEAKIEILELKSASKSKDQVFHYDCSNMASREGNRYPFNTNEYSIILALEPQPNETYINVSPDNSNTIKRVVIPQGALLIFRGDLYHGGGGYAIENRRLFFGIKTQSGENEVLLLTKPIASRGKKRISGDQPSHHAKRRSPRFSLASEIPSGPEHEIEV
jgi:hypothetical protein